MKRQENISLEELYELHAEGIFAFAYGFLKSKEEAEEAVQDIFIKFWNNKDRLKDPNACKPYLYRIAKNYLLNCLRKKARAKIEYKEIQNDIISFTSSEDLFIYNELYCQAQEAIKQLPPKRKQVFQLKYEGELSNREIARQMDISVTMVEKHWRQAVHFIKNRSEIIE